MNPLARLGAEAARGQIADSYLLLGCRGDAARAAAGTAARAILCPDGGCGHCAVCLRLAEDLHADLVRFDPRDFSSHGLKVEHIVPRKEGVPNLTEALRYRPREGGRRVVILLEVDRMLAEAQTALLKTLEEPPDRTTLVLTAADLGPLLPALRSRCRVCRLPAEGSQEAVERLAAAGVDEEAAVPLLAGLGSVDEILAIGSEERAALLAARQGFLDWVFARGGAVDWLAPPEGSNQMERRESGLRVLGTLAAAAAERYRGEADEEQLLLLDRALALLAQAAADLHGQILPNLVFTALRGALVSAATPRLSSAIQ